MTQPTRQRHASKVVQQPKGKIERMCFPCEQSAQSHS
jgi:hypothetical protein